MQRRNCEALTWIALVTFHPACHSVILSPLPNSPSKLDCCLLMVPKSWSSLLPDFPLLIKSTFSPVRLSFPKQLVRRSLTATKQLAASVWRDGRGIDILGLYWVRVIKSLGLHSLPPSESGRKESGGPPRARKRMNGSIIQQSHLTSSSQLTNLFCLSLKNFSFLG